GVLEVRDHGPGVEPSQVRRVFERFYRSDSSRGRVGGGGTGLGLAIVAAIVAAHDGRVGHAAPPGGGSTFGVSVQLTHLPGSTWDDTGDDDASHDTSDDVNHDPEGRDHAHVGDPGFTGNSHR